MDCKYFIPCDCLFVNYFLCYVETLYEAISFVYFAFIACVFDVIAKKISQDQCYRAFITCFDTFYVFKSYFTSLYFCVWYEITVQFYFLYVNNQFSLHRRLKRLSIPMIYFDDISFIDHVWLYFCLLYFTVFGVCCYASTIMFELL